MAQCISEEYTDAVLACYHEAGTIGIDALNEALVTEPLAVDDGALGTIHISYGMTTLFMRL